MHIVQDDEIKIEKCENECKNNHLIYSLCITGLFVAFILLVLSLKMPQVSNAEEYITINEKLQTMPKTSFLNGQLISAEIVEESVLDRTEDIVTDETNEVDYSWVNSDVFDNLDEKGQIELLGEMAREDMRLTGVPASLTVAQAIMESDMCRSSLSREGENYFGIKASDGGYNWKDSTWDGRTTDMKTQEHYGEGYVDIVGGFRVYDNAWDSMKDHSAYLLNSTNNGETRYPHINEVSGKEAAYILVEGGYATSPTYAESIIYNIDLLDLERFDIER